MDETPFDGNPGFIQDFRTGLGEPVRAPRLSARDRSTLDTPSYIAPGSVGRRARSRRGRRMPFLEEFRNISRKIQVAGVPKKSNKNPRIPNRVREARGGGGGGRGTCV